MVLEWRYLLVMMVLVTFWELLFFSIISLLISWGGYGQRSEVLQIKSQRSS